GLIGSPLRDVRLGSGAAAARAGTARAATASAAAPEPAAQGDAEHRCLAEVDGEGVVVAVGDRAAAVGDGGVVDAALRLERGRLGDGDAVGHPQLNGEAGAGGDRDEDAAVLDELLQVREPLEAEAAADVVRLIGAGEVGRLLRLLPRD